jgi:hypothetical protein
MYNNERQINVQRGGQNVVDSEFDSMKDRFEAEMRRVEAEMARLRNEFEGWTAIDFGFSFHEKEGVWEGGASIVRTRYHSVYVYDSAQDVTLSAHTTHRLWHNQFLCTQLLTRPAYIESALSHTYNSTRTRRELVIATGGGGAQCVGCGKIELAAATSSTVSLFPAFTVCACTNE